jgi:hypothetical protein
VFSDSRILEHAAREERSAICHSLGEFFEGLERRRREGGVEPLSEEEAVSLANEELHAMRRERRVAP